MQFLVRLGLVVGLSACGFSFDGGANTHQQVPGNNETGGVNVAVGDIGIAPTGDYLVANVGGLTILRPGFAPDPTAATMSLVSRSQKVAVADPQRLAFAWSHDVFYVSSGDDTITAIDAKTGSQVWKRFILEHDAFSKPILEISKDDRRVVYARGEHLTILDAASGQPVATSQHDNVIEDVDLLEDGRAIVTPRHRWSGASSSRTPHTMVSILSLEGDAAQTVDVPNCASNLVVSPDGARAFLAPTTCSDPMPVVLRAHDPVSVIDLTTGRFVRNLPGFGPVAVAPDGKSVVAFMDALAADASLFDDKSQIPSRKGPQFHMMVIDAQTLRFRSAPIGDWLPRYAMTPDGRVLLVDTFWFSDVVRLFDTESLEIRAVDGPKMSLANFVITPDSSHAYAIDRHELFAIDIANANAVGFRTPATGASPPDHNQTAKAWSREHRPNFIPGRINISPDGKTLYLRASVVEKSGDRLTNDLCVYSIERRDCTEWFAL